MTDTLALLFATIEARSGADPAGSHTAALLAKGAAKCAEKFGEEAVEAIVAAAQGDRAALTREAADCLYHLQVMLRATGVDLGRGAGRTRTRAPAGLESQKRPGVRADRPGGCFVERRR